MQLTIDSTEPLDRVLEVVGSLYRVRLAVVAEVPAARAKSRPGRKALSTDPVTVRRWARANGHPVKDRGRVPAAILDAYRNSADATD
jgi:hypothetical protein